jgi:hypothetical protein
MTWSQGESDYIEKTSREDYRQLFLQMYEDFADEVVRITGQSETPIIVTYQMASHRVLGSASPDIALALKDAADTHPSIYLSHPMYPLKYDKDGIHLNGDSSLMLGMYYGKVLKTVMYDKKPWVPLQPRDIRWSEQWIDVVLDVPHGPVKIDTTFVSETPNYGFDLWGEEDVLMADIITSVEVVSDDTIRIKLNTPVGSKTKLTYARGRDDVPPVSGNKIAARGNVRDSQGNTHQYKDFLGHNRRLDNYLVIFESIKQ